MPEETDTTNKPAKTPTVRKLVRLGENVPTYYVNNTEVGMTTWDVSLRLSRIEKADNEALYVRDQAIVTMSLQHAKAVTAILAGYLEQYERDNGPLALPAPGVGLVQGQGNIEVEIPTSMFPEVKPKE
jgi:hypothetical protein